VIDSGGRRRYRKRVMRKDFLALVLGTAVAVSAWTVTAQSPAITVVAPGLVTVKADGVPLGDLLRQLSALVPMDRLKIAPAALSAPVTLDAERVPVTEAMFLVLKASNVDYVMSGTRLLAGGAGQAVPGRADTAVARRDMTPADGTARNTEAERVAAASTSSVVVPSQGGIGGVASDGSAVVSDETADQFGFLVGAEVVQFKVIEDSAVVTTPGFVPYKMRPEVVARRKAADVAKIP
jgi:hypothetical protein